MKSLGIFVLFKRAVHQRQPVEEIRALKVNKRPYGESFVTGWAPSEIDKDQTTAPGGIRSLSDTRGTIIEQHSRILMRSPTPTRKSYQMQTKRGVGAWSVASPCSLQPPAVGAEHPLSGQRDKGGGLLQHAAGGHLWRLLFGSKTSIEGIV